MVEAVGATPHFYTERWRKLQNRSWTAGQKLREFGNWWYGSQWNALVPVVDERTLARMVPQAETKGLGHFIFADFATPKNRRLFNKSLSHLIGTYHCSARRLPRVIMSQRHADVYDHLVLMSESQKPFFSKLGISEDRMTVIQHGVDSNFFHPADSFQAPDQGPLQAVLVGATERDHDFMLKVLEQLPEGVVNLKVRTTEEHLQRYRGVRGAEPLPFLTEDQIRELYQKSELMVIPMLDCTANNAVMEAMACGTPVMVNRIGGIPEYVDAQHNFVMDDKNVSEWVDRIVDLHGSRTQLHERRGLVRTAVEAFDWNRIASRYLNLYEAVKAS